MADRRAIEDCNEHRIPVLFDANVLFDAIRAPDSVERAALLRVDPTLRMISDVTLYEVAFAHRGLAVTTLQENEDWVHEHAIKRAFLDEPFTKNWRRLLGRSGALLRRQTDLGDALLAAHSLALKAAIATRDLTDYDRLPVTLVREFLP